MKRRGLRKREGLKIATYEQTFRIAIRHGRKYGVTAEEAEDAASAAYLEKARGALKRITAENPGALGARIAFGGVADELRRRMTGQGGFEAGEAFVHLDDPSAPFDISDRGRSATRCRLACDYGPDPVPPTPLWQAMVRRVLDGAPKELRRVARAYALCWDSEKARRKVKMGHSKFYRLRKKLKFLLAPCLTAYREWRTRRGRPRRRDRNGRDSDYTYGADACGGMSPCGRSATPGPPFGDGRDRRDDRTQPPPSERRHAK